MAMGWNCRVKICGVRTPQALLDASVAGADAVGLVFAERSPRYIEPGRAAALAAQAPPFVDMVGLFTDTPVDEIRAIAAAVPLSTVQLHSEQYDAQAIAELAPRRVIRALSFDAATAAEHMRTWEEHYRELSNLAGLLVDSPDPSQVGGGTGVAFDWQALRGLLDDLRPSAPIILAGGLTPENVSSAIATVRPWAVDVSSGVESERGVKDSRRIKAFCQAATGAEPSRG